MTDHDRIKELLKIKDQAPLDFDPPRSALLVVDAQRYFTEPGHPFQGFVEKLVPGATAGYFKRVEAHVLGNISRLQTAFRSRGLPVIFLAAGSCRRDGRDIAAWMRAADDIGLALVGERVCAHVTDPTYAIDARVAPAPGEMAIHKSSSGPLASTKLDQTLHNLGITSLVVCGLTTAVCVTQTAREAADRSFKVVVASDACTEMSEEMHEAALLAFAYVFGRVRRTSEIEALLAEANRVETVA